MEASGLYQDKAKAELMLVACLCNAERDGDSADGAATGVKDESLEAGEDAGCGAEAREVQRSLQVLVWDPVATHELQGLPLVYAKAPLLWIPRALRDRVCAIMCGLLQDATQPRDAELANLLLFHSGQLLLRLPPSSPEEEPSGMQAEDIPARGMGGNNIGEEEGLTIQGVAACVRERVALAEKGAWG